MFSLQCEFRLRWSHKMIFLNYFIILGSLCLIVINGHSISCTTPNGEKATCVSLLSCPILLRAANEDGVAKQFVEASACGQGTLHVCCGKAGNFTQNLNESEQTTKPLTESKIDFMLRKKLLPSKTFCGFQHTDDYFYNETSTSVDEFPWLVYFVIPKGYVDNYYLRKESNCVGVLISNRYVLTSYEDCYKFIAPVGGMNHTIEMIFGQHHIYKDVSCIPTQVGVDDCTHPIIREHAFVWDVAPSWYTHVEGIGYNFGIAILRINHKIDFSDYVRPICLPIDPDDVPKPGDTVFTSGWAEEQSVDGKGVQLKKRITHTVMDEEECKSGNPVLSPICGAPFEDNTNYVCPGDNGGPFMYKHENNWIVAGIVSKTTTCDDVHPVIAEQLTGATLDWICDIIAFFEYREKKQKM